MTLPVRWIKPENLHLTLLPPWYTSEAEKLIPRLSQADLKVLPFALSFQKVTFGPTSHRPRLIWAEGERNENLAELKTALEKALKRPTEKRDFLPHLTLARFHSQDFPRFPVKKLEENVSWILEVNSFRLMESHLKRSGAEYQVLAKIPLRG
jgi:2'-5' RNA ligase